MNEAGWVVVEAQAAEALAMVRVPKEEATVPWRQILEPDSEVMAVSSDDVMVNVREEGWKEVKTVAISTVTQEVDEETGESNPITAIEQVCGMPRPSPIITGQKSVDGGWRRQRRYIGMDPFQCVPDPVCR